MIPQNADLRRGPARMRSTANSCENDGGESRNSFMQLEGGLAVGPWRWTACRIEDRKDLPAHRATRLGKGKRRQKIVGQNGKGKRSQAIFFPTLRLGPLAAWQTFGVRPSFSGFIFRRYLPGYVARDLPCETDAGSSKRKSVSIEWALDVFSKGHGPVHTHSSTSRSDSA